MKMLPYNLFPILARTNHSCRASVSSGKFLALFFLLLLTFPIAGYSQAVQLAATYPPDPLSPGQPCTITVQSQLLDGTPENVTEATVVGISFNHSSLHLMAGDTQATIAAGENSTTLTLTFFNGSGNDISTLFTVQDTDGLLAATYSTLTMQGSCANYGLNFTGSNWVEMSDPGVSSLDVTGSMTVELWFNHTQRNGGAWYYAQELAGKSQDNVAGHYSLIYMGDGSYQFIILFDNGTFGGVSVPLDAVNLNQWYHLAGVYNETDYTLTLYLNGQQVGQTTVSAGFTRNLTNDQPFLIGNMAMHLGYPFTGKIDEVRVWNTARTQQEIAANMYNRFLGATPNLAAYWRLDEGSGPSAMDISGYNNTGLLSAGTSYEQSVASMTSLTGPSSACAAPGVAYSVPFADGSQYTWTVTGGVLETSSTGSTISVDWTGATSGLVAVDVVNAIGCTYSTSLTITFVPNLVVSAGEDITVCGSSVVLGGSPTATGATGTYTYLWSPSTGLDDPTAANPVATMYTTMTYTVTVMGGCEVSSTITVTVQPAPAATLVLDDSKSSYVQTSDLLSFSNGFTIEFWARRDGNGTNDFVIGHGTQSWSSALMIGFQSDNTYTFDLYNQPFAVAGYSDNEWHHWANVYDYSGLTAIRVYRDGVLVGSLSPTNYYYGSGAITIGSSAWSTGFFNGAISDVRIWNTARSQSEIEQNMYSRLNGNEYGLVGYYPLTQGIGSALPSIPTSGYTSLHNGAGWSSELPIIGQDTICGLPTAVMYRILPAPNTTYTWQVEGGAIIASTATAQVNTITVEWATETTGSISVTADNAVCSYTTTLTTHVIISTLAIQTNDNISICYGQSVVLGGSPTASGGSGSYTYTWTPSTGLDNPSIANPIASPDRTTTYQLTVSDGVFCPLTTTVTVTVLPVASPVVALDGIDDYITVEGDYWFDGNFTAEAWVYVRSISNDARLFDFGNGAPLNNVILGLSDGMSGKVFYQTFNNSSSNGKLVSPEPLPLNEWVHLAVVQQGSVATIYKNGTLWFAGSIAAPAYEYRGTTLIGHSNWNGNTWSNMLLDEFRIWKTARTGEQIRQNMTLPISDYTDIQAYFSFNAGQATEQLSPTSNQTAILHGAVWQGMPVVAGPLNVCEYSNGINYTIAFTSSSHTYSWAIEGGTITASTTGSITVAWNGTGTGKVTVTAATAEGCIASTTLLINITNTYPTALVIDGTTATCPFTPIQYSTEEVTGATYSWTVTNGMITSGQGTTTPTVVWDNVTSGSLVLTLTNSGGCSGSVSLPVFIHTFEPYAITGPTDACINTTGSTYTIPYTNGHSYSWSVTGGVITGGQGSTTVSITWDNWSNSAIAITETNPEGCVYTTSLSVNVQTLPITGAWRYYSPIEINNTGNGAALTDFQVLVTINTQSLIAQGKMNSDGSDIRFISSSGSELCYWIESGVNSPSTRIWIKVPFIPAASSTTLTMLYSNPMALAASDGDCTFLVFDDFNGTDINSTKWQRYGNLNTSYTVTNGTITVSASSSDIAFRSSIPLSAPVTAEMKVDNVSGYWSNISLLETGSWTGYGIGYYEPSNNFAIVATTPACASYSAGLLNFTSTGNPTGIWSITRTNSTAWIEWADGTTAYSPWDPPSILNVAFGGLCTSSGAMVTDWVRVRKYADIRPTAIIGREQDKGRIVGSDTTCAELAVSYAVLPALGSTVEWSITGGNGVIIGTGNSINVIWNSTGNGQLSVSATSPLGCTESTTLSVWVLPSLIADAGSSTAICYGSSIQLGGIQTATGGTGNYSYLWSPSIGLSNPTIANPEVTLFSTTEYTLTVSDEFCTVSSTITITVAPLPDPAISLDGTNDYIFTPDLRNYLIDETMTIELWFKATSHGVLVDERGQADLNNWNTSLIEIASDGGVRIRSSYGVIYAGTVSFHTWHHVAWRYNRATFQLEAFIDGVKSSSFYILNRQSPVESGYGQYLGFGLGDPAAVATSNYFGGKVRDIRVWNIARSDSAITRDRNRNLTGSEPGLIAFYPMLQSPSTTLADVSAHGNDATLVNAPVWASDASAPTGKNSVCIDNGNQIYSVRSYPNHTYTWAVSGGDIVSTETNDSLSIATIHWHTIGNGEVTVTVATLGSCGVSTSISISVVPIALISAGNDALICYGENIQLGGSPTATGGTGPFTYQWIPSVGLDNSMSANPVATPVTTTTYTVLVSNGICTLSSSVTVTVQPVVSPVLSFNGANQYVEVPHSSHLNLLSSYTIEAWIYPRSFTSGAGIISKDNGSSGYRLGISGVYPYRGINFDNLNTYAYTLNTNNWYHIAAVNNNGIRRLYINGVEAYMGGLPLSSQHTSNPLLIGKYITNNHFNGDIADVRIWNTARSQEQITEHMYIAPAEGEPGLVAYYPLSEGLGQVIQDKSGHALTGATINNPTWKTSIIASPVSDLCEGPETVTYSVLPRAGSSYNWIVDSGTILSSTATTTTGNVVVNWSEAGTGSIELRAINTCSTTTLTSTLTIHALPEQPILVGDTVVCHGQNIFPYSVAYNSDYYYDWSVDNGTISYPDNALDNTIDVTWDTPNVIGTVTVRVTNQNNCTLSTTVNVTVKESPQPSITGVSTVCAYTVQQEYTTPQVAGSSYVWTVDGGSITSGQSTASIIVDWDSAGTGIVSVTETNTNNCSITMQLNVDIKTLPEAVISGKSEVCAGATMTYSVPAAQEENINYTYSASTFAMLSTTTAAEVSLDDDETSSALPIGFTFNFYGNEYSDFYISSNGFITFTGKQDDGCCSGQELPDTEEPNNLIAFAWSDFDPSSGGRISHYTTGAAPNRTLVVTFEDVPHCCSGEYPITTQILLHETSNIIDIMTASMPSNGDNHTMGIENADGTSATVVAGRNSTDWSLTEDAIRFTPHSVPTSAYVWSVTGGTIIEGQGSTTLTVTWSNSGYGSISIDLENASACTASTSLSISISSPIVIAIEPPAPLCYGESVVFGGSPTASGGIGTLSYLWSPSDGLDNPTTSNPTATPTTTTTYSLLVSDNFNCSATTTVTVVVNALPSPAISFDGIDDGLIAPLATTQTDNITMEAWIQWNGSTAHSNTIIANGNSVDNGYELFYNHPDLGVLCNGSGSAVAHVSLQPATWYHVAAVRNNGNWELYLDGIAQTTAGNPAPTIPNGGLGIGQNISNADNFAGSIDEVRVWSTSRTAEQLRQNMYTTLTGNESGLAAFYPLNEGRGTTSRDMSAHAQSAMFSQNPVWVSVVRLDGIQKLCYSGNTYIYSVQPVAGTSYNWSVSGGVITATSATSSSNNIAVQWITTGSWSVALDAVSENGCTITTSLNIEVNTVPTPSISGTDTVCAYTADMVYSTPNVIGHTYVWDVYGGVIIGSSTGNSISVTWGSSLAEIPTRILLTETAPDGCSLTTELPIHIYTSMSLAEIQDRTIREDSTVIIELDLTESDTEMIISVTSGNTTLLSDTHINLDGTSLFLTPAPDTYGSALLTITVSDACSTIVQTFTLVVLPVNDAPTFVRGEDVIVSEDAGAQMFSAWATSINAGPDNETEALAAFTVSNTNNALFSVQPTVSTNGTLTFTTVPDMFGTATVSLYLTDNGGTENGGVATSATQQFIITVTPVNDAPTFVRGEDVIVSEDAGAQIFSAWATNISAGPDNETEALSAFTVSNNNNALFSVQPTVSTNGTLTFTSAPDMFGTATVNIYLTDNGGTENGGVATSATQQFTITVAPVNDAPTFVRGEDVIVNEDAGAQIFSAWATSISAGPDNETETLAAFTVSNTNNALFSVQPTVSTNGTLTFTSAPDMFGTATLSIYLKDNGSTENGGVDTSATQQFTITVTSVNDAPTFVRGEDVIVSEDAGAQMFSAWATSISAGPDNETEAVAAFTVSNNNNALFSVQPTVSTNGTLTFTTAPDMFGTATVSLYLMDNGGTENGGVDTSTTQQFTITVTPVNDAPTFVRGEDVIVSEDAGAQIFSAWATSISAGPDNETEALAAFTVSNTNNALFSVQPTVSTNGTLTFTTAPDMFGTATLSIYLTDNGSTDNGGVATSATQQFIITVTPVNDAPTFVRGEDVIVNEDAGAQIFSAWATSISAGPDNETEALSAFTVNNTNNTLFSVQPTVSTNGTLTFTTAPDMFGTATVSLYLMDNGGTENGGVATSATQQFTITVTPVNDAPTFVRGEDVIVNEDAGAQIFSAWATSISAGPDNETETLAAFTVSNTNNALFSVQPVVSTNGTLTFTTAPDMFGTVTVSIYLTDNGGTENGGVATSATQQFIITVMPVNDAPVLVTNTGLTLDEGASATIATNMLYATDVDNSTSDIVYTLISVPSHGILSKNSVTISTGATFTQVDLNNNASLMYSHDGGETTSDKFTFTVSDGVGVESSVTVFSITILPVNDAPIAVDDNTDSVCYASPVLLRPLQNDFDVDENPLIISSVASPLYGTALIMPGDTTIYYTPADGYMGTDMFNYTISDGRGGSSTATISVHIFPPLLVEAGTDATICAGESTRLSGTSTSYWGAIEFRWSPATGLSNPNIADPVASPTTTTTYTLLVTDGFGCSFTDEITVTVYPAMDVQVSSAATICAGNPVQLSAAGGVNYLWSPTDGLDDPTSATPVALPTTTTSYTVLITGTGGCIVQRTVPITVVPPPVAIVGSDTSICVGNSVQLSASGGTSYMWLPVTGLSNPAIANPVASPTETTVYTITVSNGPGCISTNEVTVTIKPATLNATAILEGVFDGTTMSTALASQGLLPSIQPYSVSPFDYNGSETLNIAADAPIVDWVLVELRSQKSPSSVAVRRAALLRNDGHIVDTDGNSPVSLSTVSPLQDGYYLVVWHRNHIAVMSAVKVAITDCELSYNFTTSRFAAYSSFADGQKQLGSVFGLIGGDLNSDGIINAIDRVTVRNSSGDLGYLASDVSLDGIVNAVDRVLVRNNTFRASQVP